MNDENYNRTGMPDSAVSSPAIRISPSYPISHNDIEVIDLDSPRNQIKPTTWHT